MRWWSFSGWVVVTLSACGGDDTDPIFSNIKADGQLVLVQEKKLSTVLTGLHRYEASGVAVRDGSLYLVFDNSTRLGIVDVALAAGRFTDGVDVSSQYEGVTVATGSTPGLYAIVEADGQGRSVVVPFDENAVPKTNETTDLAFADGNKGAEGVAWLSVGGTEHLLVLCEGNGCTPDATNVGNGRIKVLTRQAGTWVTETTLSVPPQAAFVDYSDLALLPRSDGVFDIAVLSQQSSALWMGVLTTSPWALGAVGTVYDFPKTGEGALRYCNLEGVTFLDRTTLAMVSDKADGKGACGDKDESVHIFRLP